MVRESLVASIDSLSHRSDLIEQGASPDVTILDIVESFITASDEAVNGPGVSDLVLLTPVASQGEFSLIRVIVLAESGQIHDERHVATVSSEKSHALEVSLHEGSASHCPVRMSPHLQPKLLPRPWPHR